MFVVVTFVCCVPASVVDVVDVIAMRNGHVTAPLAVHVVMPLVYQVPVGGFAFVEVIVVPPVQMALVHIVDVVTVRDRDVPAPLTVRVVMPDMLSVSYSVHISILIHVPDGTKGRRSPNRWHRGCR